MPQREGGGGRAGAPCPRASLTAGRSLCGAVRDSNRPWPMAHYAAIASVSPESGLIPSLSSAIPLRPDPKFPAGGLRVRPCADTGRAGESGS